MRIDYRITGLDELVSALRSTPGELNLTMRAMFKGILEIWRDKLVRYPPKSQANVPPGVNGYSWYERGFGTRTITGRAYPTSEVLGRSYSTEVKGAYPHVKGILGSRASYSPYVHDQKSQAEFHTRRGWPTVQETVRVTRKQVTAFADRLMMKVIQRISNRQ